MITVPIGKQHLNKSLVFETADLLSEADIMNVLWGNFLFHIFVRGARPQRNASITVQVDHCKE